MLRDIRAGRTRADSLRDLVDRTGRPIGTERREQRDPGGTDGLQLRATVAGTGRTASIRALQQAEKLALEAPVKLLGPLVMFIFPTTFLVLIYLMLSKALLEGVITWEPLVWAYRWPGG